PPGGLVSPNSRNVNPKYVSSPPYAGPYTGVLAFLLPYIEQDAVYKQLYAINNGGLFKFDTTTGAWAYNTPPFDFDTKSYPSGGPNGTGYPHICDARIPTFECPSDDAAGATVSNGVIDAYFVIGTSIWIDYVWDYPGYGHEMGPSNYIASAGRLGLGDPTYTGIYYQNSKTKVTSITDGTSNTITFAETL